VYRPKTERNRDRLKPTPIAAVPPGVPWLSCDVLAHGSVRAGEAEIAALRPNPAAEAGIKLPAGFLKHAEEQTVVGLAAVYQAVHRLGVDPAGFRDWSVLGAPRFIGRLAMANAIARFVAEGAWGVSPHLIPHRSLHAVSGTVSQALKIHGPNFGVGGGISGASEALVTAISLTGERRTPGVWVVLTGWDPEPVAPGADPAPHTPSCNGLALALVAPRVGWRGWRLHFGGEAVLRPEETPEDKWLSLERLQSVLDATSRCPVAATWNLRTGGYLAVEQPTAAHADRLENETMPSANDRGLPICIPAGTETSP
jgi:hypothetical protein